MSAVPSHSHNSTPETAADPSMEEILASIRRIIADDHGTPITPRPSRSAAAPVVEGRGVAPASAPAAPPVYAPAPAPAAVSPPPAPRREPPQVSHPLAPAPAAARVIETPAPEGFDVRAPAAVRESVMDRVARLDALPMPPRARPVVRHPLEEPAPAIEHGVEHVAEPARIAPDLHAPTAPSPLPAHVPESVEQAAEPLMSPLVRASVSSAFEALTLSMSVQNTSMVEEAVRDMLRPMLKEWLDDNLPTIVERLVRAEIERVARGGRS